MNLLKTLTPPVFQGSLKNKNYFEGWYFKQTASDSKAIISIIPGISLSSDPHSFIQIIDGKTGVTAYHSFPLDAFSASSKKMEIKIGKNYFSESKMVH